MIPPARHLLLPALLLLWIAPAAASEPDENPDELSLSYRGPAFVERFLSRKESETKRQTLQGLRFAIGYGRVTSADTCLQADLQVDWSSGFGLGPVDSELHLGLDLGAQLRVELGPRLKFLASIGLVLHYLATRPQLHPEVAARYLHSGGAGGNIGVGLQVVLTDKTWLAFLPYATVLVLFGDLPGTEIDAGLQTSFGINF